MTRFVKFALCASVAVAVLAAGSAEAQGSTTGSIRGTVTDPQGGVLPGATVRALSDALVAGQQAAITSGSGVYRFPSLPVGTYVLEASLPGFQPVRQENVVVGLGQSLSIDLQLGDVTVSEEIVVVADAVQVSTVDNNVGFNLGGDFIERLPIARDPTDLMNYAPGIQNDQAYGAPSTYQNAYNVDGVDVSDPELGSQWVLPSMDWVEEVQVAGLGADAEYGGFTGAVVNLVTKSGGNEFHGDARIYYSGGDLNSENAPEGAEGVNSVSSDVDASLSVGGPVIKDALWYFVSGNLRERQVEPFYTEGAPLDDREDSDRTETRVLGKLTWQLNSSNRLMGMIDWDDVVHDYRAVGDLTLASASERQESPNYVYNLSWESLVNDSNFLTAKITGYTGGDDRLPYGGQDTPGRYDLDTGFEWVNLDQTSYKDVDRVALDLAWSLFADGLLAENDSHNFKFGVNVERSNSDYVTRRNGGFTYVDDTYYCDSIAAYFADPSCALFSSDREGEWNLRTEMEGAHAYVQDEWQYGNVAVNLGVRYSKYVGNFADPVFEPTSGGSDVYDVDMWSPRVGFVWDILGTSKLVFKSHYGIYYEGMTVTMFDREASGDALSNTEYWDWDFGEGDWVFYDEVIEASADMNPGIEHPSVEQLVATVEYQLLDDMVVGIDYIDRSYKDINAMVVSNVGDYDAYTTLPSPSDSPLAGDTLPFFELIAPQEFLITNPDFATREYESVALRARKRYSNGWSLDSSLVWSDSAGTADYAFAGYGTGFDDLNGFTNAQGKLPFNSEWVFKASASVDLPWTMTLSGFYQWRSGEYWTPYVRLRGLFYNDRTTAFMTPRGSEQYDDRSMLDLRLDKTFNLGGAMALSLFVDAFNVLDSDTVTAVAQRWGDYFYDYIDPTDPGFNEWVESSTYGTPISIQTPREIRIGAKFSW